MVRELDASAKGAGLKRKHVREIFQRTLSVHHVENEYLTLLRAEVGERLKKRRGTPP